MSTASLSVALPPAVPPGGVLRVVAPSGVIDRERTLGGARVLRQLGFTVQLPPELIGRADLHLPYLAGSDDLRAHELEDAFADPAVHGVVCARGGYGAMRLFPHLNPDHLRAHPKPLIGFSDVTALHGYFATQVGLASWHGPVLQSLPTLQSSVRPRGEPQHPIDALVGAITGQWRASRLRGVDVLRPGRAQGPLVGGNLSLVHALAGSPWFPDLTGAILFLEEVGEAAYRIDRMLWSLVQRGALRRVTAILFGDMGGGVRDRFVSPERFGPVVRLLKAELAEELEVPVVAGLPIGHAEHNQTLPFGTAATLEADEAGWRLEITSAVCGGVDRIA